MILKVSIFMSKIEPCIMLFLRGTGTLPRKIACRQIRQVFYCRHGDMLSCKAVNNLLRGNNFESLITSI